MDDLAIGDRQIRQVHLSVTHDTVCPWCFVGWREMERAMKTAQNNGLPLKFHVEFRPYRLNPYLPEDTLFDKKQYLINKFGEERFEQITEVLRKRGKLAGIDFTFSGTMRRTGACHRLLRHAYEKQKEIAVCTCPRASETCIGGKLDVQGNLANQIFSAYFERGEDIGDYDVLGACAENAGLMTKAEAVSLLESNAHSDAVENLIESAQDRGITGVPHTLIDGKWAVVGGQSSDTFYKIFERLAMCDVS